jgi:hypothetical protein
MPALPNARHIIYQTKTGYSSTSKRTLWSSPNHCARIPAQSFSLRRVDFRKNATPKRISSAVLVVGAAVLVWHWDELKFLSIASVRIGRVSIAATKAVLDYKNTYGKEYSSETEKLGAISACHSRAAGHVLKALLANGGVFIKLVSFFFFIEISI